MGEEVVAVNLALYCVVTVVTASFELQFVLKIILRVMTATWAWLLTL